MDKPLLWLPHAISTTSLEGRVVAWQATVEDTSPILEWLCYSILDECTSYYWAYFQQELANEAQ